MQFWLMKTTDRGSLLIKEMESEARVKKIENDEGISD